MARLGPLTSGRLGGSNINPIDVQFTRSRPEVGGPSLTNAFLEVVDYLTFTALDRGSLIGVFNLGPLGFLSAAILTETKASFNT
jgi:hypothetical protein